MRHSLLPSVSQSQLHSLLGLRHISSLKVPWRKDPALDAAIDRDKHHHLCHRVVREVLHEPNKCISLRYLEKRRERLRLNLRVRTFLDWYPNLLELYPDRIKPNSSPVPFLRPSQSLLSFLSRESDIRSRNEPLVLAKLCKLLMISKDRAIPVEKILEVRRLFGFPEDLVDSLVPRYPELVRESNGHIHLVSWNESFAKSVIEQRADEESEVIGVRVRPNFSLKLPKGFNLKKEMREWVRDWLELPYVSPYSDASELSTASREMEKRNIAVLHEFLSLTIQKRAPVPTIGKFCSEFRLSNAFSNAFTRHPGIFYVSLKGGIKTAMLREAYGEDGVLLERDPLLEVMVRFGELVDEGNREYLDGLKREKQVFPRHIEMEKEIDRC
ncbi:Ubiquitin carboxyl-terminal hydrolase family protein [Rhynchospora pubera]|uniref:Ubiquitin carboxyl-terminal hydrolase family protein n=1 Tax=Rhynchospora pubera TaxID=906938 RepID=A0AAV8DK75_9POAL|nr:Ubiquitin carboxyl-terminal hydrolase family protein [Rhynchospora pubera]